MARDWAYGRPPGEVRPRPSQPPPPIQWRRVGVVAASGVVVVGALGGVAQAFWTTTGTGTGTAAAGVAQALTTTAGVAPTSLLYPGGPAADVRVVVSNPNPFPVSITGVSITGPATTTQSGCSPTGVTVQAPSGGTTFLASARVGSTNGTGTTLLVGALKMDSTSASACQGAVFSVPITLTATS